MEIRQLRYFVAIVEAGGFGKAARDLHIVQAAVSQQIQRLERELGLRLFDRTTRQVRLTREGEQLLPEVYSILAAVDRTRALAADLTTGRRRTVRIGVGRAFDIRTREFLDDATRRDPELHVQEVGLSRDDRLRAVLSGEVDAALVRAAGSVPGLERSTLWSEQLVAAFPASHPAASQDVVRLERFAALPLRLAPREANPEFHDLVLDACRTAGFEPRPGPAFTGIHHDLYEIGRDGSSWTVFYPLGELAPSPGVALRPIEGLTVPVDLVFRPGHEPAWTASG